jgi:hypothetical protein
MLILGDVVAITSRNAGTVRTRTVGSSLYNMAVQTSNIISTQVRSSTPICSIADRFHSLQIYQNKDKPLYYTGNKVLLGIAAYNVVLFVGAKFYYTWKNKYVGIQLQCKTLSSANISLSQRDQIWDSMTRDEKVNYLATTTDKGNKRCVLTFHYLNSFS